MHTQKEIAQALDSQAKRAYNNPATSKQCWFLAKLILDNETDFVIEQIISDAIANFNSALSKKSASSQISDYLGA